MTPKCPRNDRYRSQHSLAFGIRRHFLWRMDIIDKRWRKHEGELCDALTAALYSVGTLFLHRFDGWQFPLFLEKEQNKQRSNVTIFESLQRWNLHVLHGQLNADDQLATFKSI